MEFNWSGIERCLIFSSLVLGYYFFIDGWMDGYDVFYKKEEDNCKQLSI